MKSLRVVVAAASFLFVPTVALAQVPTRQHEAQYSHLYSEVRSQFGKKAAGCKLKRSCHGRVTDARMVHSIQVLQRMLAPPAPPAAAPAVVAAQAPQGTSYVAPVTATVASTGACGGITPYSGGGQCWAIPYRIVQCESGGQNVPNATGSPAQGYYQIEGGGGSGSKAQQDQAAARMYASQGSTPWNASSSCWG